jgi:hypothetical protein
MPRRLDGATAGLWQQRLQRFQRAGRSVPDFCAHVVVSTASFYPWRRRLGPRPPVVIGQVGCAEGGRAGGGLADRLRPGIKHVQVAEFRCLALRPTG